ncbi:MAG: glycosyltransferase [Armatimonadota bacterium]
MTAALAVLAMLVAAQTVLLIANLTYLRRRRPTADGEQVRISVLIPVRNERANLPGLLAALAEQTHAPVEIIVCDDQSDDGTGAWLADHAEEFGAGWFVSADRPAGWVGKTWACDQLGRRASGDWLLFLDADTHPGPEFLALMADACAETDALVVTALPRLPASGVGDALIVGMVPFGVLTTLPLWLAEKHPNPGFAFANGQALALPRSDYQALRPHETVRWAFVEDMQLAMLAKRLGRRVRIVDARSALAVRMYAGLRKALDGFSKNAAEITRGPLKALAVAALLAIACTLALAGAATGNPLGLAIVGVNVLLFGGVWLIFGMSPLIGLIYPLSVLLTVVILVRSAWWHLTGRVRWKGRIYSSRPE